MEWVLQEHSLDAPWSPGEPWPQAPDAPGKLLCRHQPDPPLLTLSLGPLLSVPLIPRPTLPSDAAGSAADGEDLQLLIPAAGQPGEVTPCPAVARLRCLVAAREPGLEAQLQATGETADAAFFARWLKARSGSPEAAAAGILAHAAWRQEFVSSAAADAVGAEAAGTARVGAAEAAASAVPLASSASGIPEVAIADELAARKVFLQGCNARGCPVVVVKAARHDMGHRDLRQTKRLIVYVLDSACAAANTRANPGGQLCCLFDLSGLRPRNLDVKVLLAIFELLQQHYPERLNSLYFINAPFLFWGMWHVVSPFVHAGTRQKIRFVAGRTARAELVTLVPSQVLPAEYGGEAQLMPIDVAVAAWRRQLQERCVAAAASDASDTASSTSGGSAGGHLARVAALRRHTGSALHTTRRFVHQRVVRPVGGAAAGAARALRSHHQQLLRRHSGDRQQALLAEQVQHSLLAAVVLRHVLLVGLLFRMLRRVLLRRPSFGAAAVASSALRLAAEEGSDDTCHPAAPKEPAAKAPAGPAEEGTLA